MMVRTMAAVMVAFTAVAWAAEKAPAKPVGTWERSVDSHKVAFTFNADGTMKIAVEAGTKKIDIAGEYGVTKDGSVYAVMTKVTKDIDEGPEKGDLMGFSVSVTDKELTISELKGSRMNDAAKKIVEGTYSKK